MYHKDIFNYLAGCLPASQKNEVESWISGNKEKFEDLKNIWEHNATFESLEPKWHEFKKLENETRKIGTKFKIQFYLKVAAIFIGLFLLTSSAFVYFKKDSFYSAGKIYTEVLLPDGSTVFLNKQTTIKWHTYFFKNRRQILLNGEAFFDVKKMSGQNFMVKTKNLKIEVLGTRFNVQAYRHNSLETVVVQSGKVKVSENEGSLIQFLSAGEKIDYLASGKKFHAKSKIDFENQNYKLRQLEFNETPVEKVVTAINHFYGTEVEIVDRSVTRFKITAIFQSQPLDSVLAALNHKLYFRVKGEGPFIKKKAGNR